jgi:hypothetical protein
MFPPVFRTLSTPAVVEIVGNRIGRHGEVPQETARPYITWSIITGQPYDHLSGAPRGDFDTVQIDCWHATDAGIEQLALAVRDALDSAGHANRVRLNNRDATTKLYRVGIDADFITNR